MTEEPDRRRILKGIKKSLSNAYDFFQDAMDTLDAIGKGSVAPGMAPLIGGFAMKNPKDNYRTAMIKVDAAEKALQPLTIRFRDGRVNDSHFTDEEAIRLLKDLTEFDYQLLISILTERKGRESVWYRLRELSEKTEQIFNMVASS